MKYAHVLLGVLLLGSLPQIGLARVIPVTTNSELTDAVKKLKPGDIVELSAGRWDAVSLNISRSGTAKKPILIKGVSGGKTMITGRSSIGIGGRHLIVSDLHFVGVEPPSGKGAIFSFRDANNNYAQESRLSNCVFESCNPRTPRRYMWVQLYGKKNRVDHNLFANQRHSGVTIQVKAHDVDLQHRIDHNHFVDRPDGGENGFEIIQIGQSSDSEKSGNCLVDSNLFERCDGEIEIVSSKTCGNTFRGNVFLESAGCLTLRHGNDCLVEGNIFIGKGKRESSGVRVIGTGHVIRNNYFEGLYGRTGGVIVLYTGIPNSKLSGYFAAHDTVIENNLIVNSEGEGICLDGGYGERGRTILPTGVKIRSNVIDTVSDEIDHINGELPDAELVGNIFSNPSGNSPQDLSGNRSQSLYLRRTDKSLLEPYTADQLAVFNYIQEAPNLLKRKEVGPSWYVVLPNFVLLNPVQVSRVVRGEAADLSEEIDAVIREANAVVNEGRSYSVASNDLVPPSGDIRSYYSTGPYWWRNPDTEDGLPYIRKDGEFNPERDLVSDRGALHAMVADVWSLAMAYQASGDERYALCGQKLLRAWFLDETTGMLPNLNHAQAIPGKSDGRGTGIIDALVFVELVDALRLLESSFTWSLGEQAAVKAWFEDYLVWMTDHPNGVDERNAKNNHGTAYDLQQLSIADYLGKEKLALQIIERVKTVRIANQISPDGSQPLELARTRSWSYCTENLEHFTRIARIGWKYGRNIYAYRSDDGASLLNALGYLLPHACDPQATWKAEQVTQWQSEYIYATISILCDIYKGVDLVEILNCIPVPHDALLSKLMR